MAKMLHEFFKEKEKSPIQGPINVFDEIANQIDSTNMIMDMHSMNRKDLQALCQKHSIRANLSNLKMAKRLSEFFKEIDKPSIQGLINEQDENAATTRKVKKVRFSPELEMFEFTRSRELKRRSGRNSVLVTPSNFSVQTVDNSKTSRENVDGQGRVTRSRGSKLTEGHVNETKRGIMFHSMKRRELQTLCQKHNIPANLSNLEMAKRLDEFFKEKEKPPIQGPIIVLDEIAKEMFEFTRSPELKRKSRRNSVSVRPVDRARQSVGCPIGRHKRIVKKPAGLLY